MSEPENEIPPVEIPLDSITPEALSEIIASFVEREGTDYGDVEAPFERKVSDIRRQLDKGDLKLFFDPNSETVTFLPASNVARSKRWVKLGS